MEYVMMGGASADGVLTKERNNEEAATPWYSMKTDGTGSVMLSPIREFGSWSMSGEITHLATALALAQASIRGAHKGVQNTFFKAPYADLGSVWEACREALSANGLSIVQLPERVGPSEVGVVTILLHASGQFITSRVSAKLAKDDPQQVGSVITYLRRYALAAMAGVAQTDDDGELAMGRGGPKQTFAAGGEMPPKTPSNITTTVRINSPAVTDQMVRNLFIVAKKSNHDEDKVRKYVMTEFKVDVPNLALADYAPVLKRLSDKAPL